MASRSDIEWTDATWNPLRGCSRVSEGCRHCYAEAFAGRFAAHGQPWHEVITRGRWNGRVQPAWHALAEPMHWTRARRVFVCSMSDLFHEEVVDDFRDLVFAVMLMSPRHTFQVLTKRPERMRAYVVDLVEGRRPLVDAVTSTFAWLHDDLPHVSRGCDALIAREAQPPPYPLPPHIWLGASVEDQRAADQRVPALIGTPAAVRFLSCEPLLGPVNLAWWLPIMYGDVAGWTINPLEVGRLIDGGVPQRPALSWVIAGGESGGFARPMHPCWARSLRDQCAAAGIPFFFKQWGTWAPAPPLQSLGERYAPRDAYRLAVLGGDVVELGDLSLPGDVMRRGSKFENGRTLDGREHGDYPEVPHAHA